MRETFFRMFRDGYIFRGKRLVNWDTQLQTSVADDETYTEDIKGGFWTFKYPVTAGSVSDRTRVHPLLTTRPETMLGDTAVCVHPERRALQAPDRQDGDDPARGPRDPDHRRRPARRPGARHRLREGDAGPRPERLRLLASGTQRSAIINILNPDGTINENGGKYQGLDRYKAREAVVEDMEELGLFEGKEDRVIPLKYSDRSKTPIEPYLSDQWFVKMGDRDDGKPGLAQMAMDAVTSGRVKFFPERYAKTLPRLARREARLVHQPATLVGPPDSGVVRTDVSRERRS